MKTTSTKIGGQENEEPYSPRGKQVDV